MSVINPQLVLFNTIRSILKTIRSDWAFYSDKSRTILYKILHDQQAGNFDFYKEGQEIFLKKSDDPRILDVRMFFDIQRASIPTIHINMPGEVSGDNGLGVDAGFNDPEFNEEDGTFTEVNNRRFNATYNIIITSDNSMEVLLIYTVIRTVMIGIFDHVSLSGLENPKLGGFDLQINSDLVPLGIFMRSLKLDCSYEIPSAQIFTKEIITNLIFNGTPYEETEQSESVSD